MLVIPTTQNMVNGIENPFNNNRVPGLPKGLVIASIFTSPKINTIEAIIWNV